MNTFKASEVFSPFDLLEQYTSTCDIGWGFQHSSKILGWNTHNLNHLMDKGQGMIKVKTWQLFSVDQESQIESRHNYSWLKCRHLSPGWTTGPLDQPHRSHDDDIDCPSSPSWSVPRASVCHNNTTVGALWSPPSLIPTMANPFSAPGPPSIPARNKLSETETEAQEPERTLMTKQACLVYKIPPQVKQAFHFDRK